MILKRVMTAYQKNDEMNSVVPGRAFEPEPSRAGPRGAGPSRAQAVLKPAVRARPELSKARAEPKSPGLLILVWLLYKAEIDDLRHTYM